MESFTGVAVFAVVIFAVSVIISLLPLQIKKANINLHSLLALSAGIMIGILFLMIMPEALEESHEAGYEFNLVLGIMLAGFVALLAINAVLTRGKPWEHSHEFTSMSAFGGLAIHAAFDGVSLAAGFVAGEEVGLMILVALCIHKCAEVFSLSSTMAVALPRNKTILYMTIFSAVTPVFAVVSYFLITGESSLVGPAMALSCGILLFVVAMDMLPDIFHECHGNDYRKRLAIFIIGIIVVIALIFLMSAITGGSGHHHH